MMRGLNWSCDWLIGCLIVVVVVLLLVGWLVEIFIDAATKSFEDKIRHPLII